VDVESEVRLKEEPLNLQVRLLTPTFGMKDCVKSRKNNFVSLTYFPVEIRQPKLQNDTKLIVIECRTIFKKTDPEAVAD
jgi:hypothetical protein